MCRRLSLPAVGVSSPLVSGLPMLSQKLTTDGRLVRTSKESTRNGPQFLCTLNYFLPPFNCMDALLDKTERDNAAGFPYRPRMDIKTLVAAPLIRG